MDATHLQGFVGHFASRRFVPLGRSSSERAMSFPGCFSCVLFNERLTCSWYRNGALSVAFAWACDYANDSRTNVSIRPRRQQAARAANRYVFEPNHAHHGLKRSAHSLSRR